MEYAIQTYGYPNAFLWFGLGQGAVVLLTAAILRAPGPNDRLPPAPPRLLQSTHSSTPTQMLASPMFWLIYVMMTMVSTGGLMMIGQFKKIASDLGVRDVPITVLGLTLTTLTFAMTLDRVLNGLTRPFFGWVSDRIGREVTMAFAFALEGFAILMWIQFAHNPTLFVLLSGLAFFAWGEVFSLFPALLGDTFGPRYATANYSLLYTSKGTAALLVLLGGYLKDVTHSWWPGFYLAVGFDWTAALLALFVLLPLRRRLPSAGASG
jgi:OFA family oxalate/formate antiporter-like MFS transporter